MFRKSLAFAAFAFLACAATASFALTLTDGFESGNMDAWDVILNDEFLADAYVLSIGEGAQVRSGQYSMCMYANGPGTPVNTYIGAWWPNLEFGDSIPRAGEFRAWVSVEECVATDPWFPPELYLEATYIVNGVEGTNGIVLPLTADASWHEVYITYNPDYDDTNGALQGFCDGGLCGEWITPELKGGQFTGGGFSVFATFDDRLKFWADDCEVNVVPEPGSLMALGCGLFALAGAALSRRR